MQQMHFQFFTWKKFDNYFTKDYTFVRRYYFYFGRTWF
jgi:hypothetical protein